ncbi:MAG: hypothetical protein GWP05_07555 [Anaerolineaceae bacterium]|nr:hypothetical protein [Anaerolineaceae bacterium]
MKLLPTCSLLVAALCGCRGEADRPPAGAGPSAAVETPLAGRLVRTIRPGLAGLKGIAADGSGRFYLAGRRGVTVFDSEWKKLRQLPTPNQATAVALDDSARVYVTERRRVHVFSGRGRLLDSWGEPGKGRGQLSFVTGITVAGANLWLADAGNRVVHRFTPGGDFIDDIGGRDPQTGRPGIICPSPYLDVAASGDGTLYVGNPGKWRVEQYDLNGRLVRYWGAPGLAANRFQGCCNPTNLALTPEGNFVTAEKGAAPRVKVSDGRGRLLALMGKEYFTARPSAYPGARNAGLDIAVTGQGRIFVVDPARGVVLEFELEER